MTATLTSETSDLSRLRTTADFVKQQDTTTLLSRLLPGLNGQDLKALAERCRFCHAALLVFPSDERTLQATLADLGLLTDAPPQPSVVVRDRLAARHRRHPAELDLSILRPSVSGHDGTRRMVEVFALTVAPGSDLEPIAAHERTHQHEAHVAFQVLQPDPLVVRGLCATFQRYGAMPDGGGYNQHEHGTVLYFTAPAHSTAEYQRIELYAPGDHRDALAAHLAASQAHQPAETLLRLLTGAWTTQALAAFAQLQVPDAMCLDQGVSAEDLARTIGATPENLATLLRYLSMLGAVSEHPSGFRLTELGALLRTHAPGSMRALALMYAGPFYQSFAKLEHTVRTGQVAFEHHFGENHFAHFARDPELAELFDQSMVSGARMFDPIPTHPVLIDAATRPSAPPWSTSQAATANSSAASSPNTPA